MHADDGARMRRDGGLDEGGIDVVAAVLDIDEHRGGAAIADGIGGGDERVADGYDLVAGLDAEGKQGKMQSGGAARHSACERRADEGRKFLLEGRDLGSLR